MKLTIDDRLSDTSIVNEVIVKAGLTAFEDIAILEYGTGLIQCRLDDSGLVEVEYRDSETFLHYSPKKGYLTRSETIPLFVSYFKKDGGWKNAIEWVPGYQLSPNEILSVVEAATKSEQDANKKPQPAISTPEIKDRDAIARELQQLKEADIARIKELDRAEAENRRKENLRSIQSGDDQLKELREKAAQLKKEREETEAQYQEDIRLAGIAAQEELDFLKSEKAATSTYGFVSREMICPHCGKKGMIHTKSVTRKAGISGGKATSALLTGGLSLFVAGLSRKEKLTQAHCRNCSSTWHI